MDTFNVPYFSTESQQNGSTEMDYLDIMDLYYKNPLTYMREVAEKYLTDKDKDMMGFNLNVRKLPRKVKEKLLGYYTSLYDLRWFLKSDSRFEIAFNGRFFEIQDTMNSILQEMYCEHMEQLGILKRREDGEWIRA